ncbi:glycoside hydrolase superfamily, partial [Phaeosphaeria sp. MPI-PUGE-AT-0046c]
MSSTPSIPHLLKTASSSHHLIVHNSPFLLLPAELHNSTLSSAPHMSATNIWPSLASTHINTVLGSVSWRQIEPTEGSFDFSNLRAILADAREYGMKVILLWFGSYKNGMSTYVPGWVKRDVGRFPRCHVFEAGGRKKTVEVLSPFCKEACEADGRAFGALMEWLRDEDGVANTVIMVQVENEVGLLGDARDRSRVADELFDAPVPIDLVRCLHLKELKGGLHPEFVKRFPNFSSLRAGTSTWIDVFGKRDIRNAEEIFMAYHFSRYVEHVAAAGKRIYPLPLYTNAWLNADNPAALDPSSLPSTIAVGGGDTPGIYPSGGPVPHCLDVYSFNCPSIDFFSPDIYFHNYETMCRDYSHDGQPLFIPEQQRTEKGARRIWSAYANYGALGCSPFGIDSATKEETRTWGKHFGLMHSVRKQILDAQAKGPGEMLGFFFDEFDATRKDKERSWTKVMGGFEVIIERAFVFGTPGPGAGMVIHQGEGKFLCIGWGFNVSFRSTNPKSTFTGILHVEEKEADPETCELKTMRLLNGDETRGGKCLIMPNEDPDYGGFPVAVTIPARTAIAECWAYSLEEQEGD